MRVLVTGCAGFIGSTLTDRLLAAGYEVKGYDNFSTGRRSFLGNASAHAGFELLTGDLLDLPRLTASMAGCDMVFHLAANADVRFGTEHPSKDLHQNTIATCNVLESMRLAGVPRIAFASTGSVYGEADVFPTPENARFPVQTSLYAASKLSAEAFIEAYSEGFGIQAFIFRFVSILGERYTHGHIVDFYKQLLVHPDVLYVQGNGKQRKSYLYVHDCVDAILIAIGQSKDRVVILNLGTDEYCEVNDSIGWICEALGIRPRLEYSGGERGWTGDNPFIFLDCAAVRKLGWRPKLTIRQGVLRTVQYLQHEYSALELANG